MKTPLPAKSAPRGRPPTFDREEALDTALDLFWRHGYDGVTIADLTQAMGIAAPSLYHAFGGKADLYRQVLRRYSAGGLSSKDIANAPSSLAAARLLLHQGAAAVTGPVRPLGCMISSGMLMTSSEHVMLATELATARADTRLALQKRIEQDISEGVLPTSMDASVLARLVAAVLLGMSVQALDGASLGELRDVGDALLRTWPDEG